MMIYWAGIFSGGAVAMGASWFLFRYYRRRLGRFLSLATHEISAPLTTMQMTAFNLAAGSFGEVPNEARSWIEALGEQVGRLNGMLCELRDFIHYEMHGDLAPIPEAISVEDVIDSALGAVIRSVTSAGIVVECSIPPGLARLNCDRQRTARFLQSLIHFARKFRSSGPILISAQGQLSAVRIDVRFAAEGLSLAKLRGYLDSIYAEADQKGLEPPTAGLGLGLLRTFARHAGGDFDLVVEAEGLWRLSLFVPAPFPTASFPVLPESVTIKEPSPMAAKILVVDDEVGIAELLKTLLKSRGYDVLVAFDGAQALQRARMDKPDLLLLDVMLPKLGGLDVCRTLKSEPATQQAKIIMLTGLGRVTDVEAAFKNGADDYITKPFEPELLVKKIEKVLQR